MNLDQSKHLNIQKFVLYLEEQKRKESRFQKVGFKKNF